MAGGGEGGGDYQHFTCITSITSTLGAALLPKPAGGGEGGRHLRATSVRGLKLLVCMRPSANARCGVAGGGEGGGDY